jgi:hypothetical protein
VVRPVDLRSAAPWPIEYVVPNRKWFVAIRAMPPLALQASSAALTSA